jgi:hypothetical protein
MFASRGTSYVIENIDASFFGQTRATSDDPDVLIKIKSNAVKLNVLVNVFERRRVAMGARPDGVISPNIRQRGGCIG